MSELSPKGGSEGYGVCSDIMACAAGRSSVRVVPHTADVKLSRSTTSRLCFYCRGAKLVFLETNRHIPMTIRHTQSQSNF